MLTTDSPFVAPPRIEQAHFARVLAEAGSPWSGRAAELYDLIAAHGHDPAVWLAICAAEHSYGTNRDSVLWRIDSRSWTNARSVRHPELHGWSIVRDPVRRSDYVRYADVADSLRDGMYRITDPTYRYAREGRTTIGAVIAIWSEGDSTGYAASVVRRMNAWQGLTSLSGLVDIRTRLATADRAGHGPRERRPLGQKRGLVVHYSGPPVANRSATLAVLQAEARYHVDKDWSSTGQPAIYGDGLMYHIAIGDDGTRYLCRDLEAVLWHCGAWPQNALALSVHLPIGGEQRATAVQLAALTALVEEWRAITGTPRGEVWGHRELQPTSCPGSLMTDFVYPYRAGRAPRPEDGEVPMSTGQWFPETGRYVGGAFWQFWHSRGGLPIFGYPLTNELREDGRTVQYFERAVFEWHPANPDPYKVLLRRLGAEALERVTSGE
jgi:hypothetical protein